MDELLFKHQCIRTFIEEQNLDALLLQRVSSFAWATCGKRSYVAKTETNGTASLWITPARRIIFTNTIEAPRLAQEEGLELQGWDFRLAPWYEASDDIHNMMSGLRVGADGPFPGAIDLSKEISLLRSKLTPEEGERFRALGKLCAEAMDSAIRSIQPGMSEHEIAARLELETSNRGVLAVVTLVACDERVFAYRHPLPTDRRMKRYAMLVVCGRKWGLVCSITRLVHFGPIPPEIQEKAQAVAQVDATFIAGTRPGRKLGDIFQEALAAYEAIGYPEEWQRHHQGGSTGYEPRETIATPESTETVTAGQAYAWNPSIRGTKSEDTILIADGGFEVLSTIPGWPMLEIRTGDQIIPRPAILEIT